MEPQFCAHCGYTLFALDPELRLTVNARPLTAEEIAAEIRRVLGWVVRRNV